MVTAVKMWSLLNIIRISISLNGLPVYMANWPMKANVVLLQFFAPKLWRIPSVNSAASHHKSSACPFSSPNWRCIVASIAPFWFIVFIFNFGQACYIFLAQLASVSALGLVDSPKRFALLKLNIPKYICIKGTGSPY